jgi:alpha-galactosidase
VRKIISGRRVGMQCRFLSALAGCAVFGSVVSMTGTTLAGPTSPASTPPMGWNSWNHFAEKVNDAVVRAQADAMVSSGLRDVGYVYINIDDTWEGKRDAQGVIHSNAKFPDMKALADYVHSKGLKLGIYSSPGPKTCAGFEGSYGHEEQDAKSYADWGVDYLKYDLCSFNDLMAKASSNEQKHKMMIDAYLRMHRAIMSTGRPIVFSLCQYGLDSVWQWGASVGGNLWRTTEDIADNYESMTAIGFRHVTQSRFAGPGHWNDPDMLEVGNGGMSVVEYQTHMSLWALLAAPLLAGNDLSTMSAQTIALLTNRGVIGIDQDVAGKQGTRVWAQRANEVWVKELADGSRAVGFFNRSDEMADADIEIRLSDLGFTSPVTAQNVWTEKGLGTLRETIKVAVPSHGVVLLKVGPTK